MIDRRSPPNNQKQKSVSKSPNNFKALFGNFIPPKVEVRLGQSAPSMTNGANGINSNPTSNPFNGIRQQQLQQLPKSNPIEIAQPSSSQSTVNSYNKTNGSYNGAVAYKSEKKKSNQQRRYAYNKNQAFGTPVDDPLMDEEFDFEKNLALFDKQAIWDEIDAIQKPDLLRQTSHAQKKNYRHDENVLDSKPVGCRQIQINYRPPEEYVTDDGVIIPAIPNIQRARIQLQAESNGLSWDRQCDMLARSAVELALQLLGGARRLSPKNQHQWPKIAIICGETPDDRHSDIALSTGRQLASQGLKVFIYGKRSKAYEAKTSKEAELFKATGNVITDSIDGEKCPVRGHHT